MSDASVGEWSEPGVEDSWGTSGPRRRTVLLVLALALLITVSLVVAVFLIVSGSPAGAAGDCGGG